MSGKLRAMDIFLTEEEQRLLTNYLNDGVRSPAIKELWTRKYVDWDKSINIQIPSTAITYRTSLKKNDIYCAIEEFLKGLKKIIDDETLIHAYSHILEDLERGRGNRVLVHQFLAKHLARLELRARLGGAEDAEALVGKHIGDTQGQRILRTHHCQVNGLLSHELQDPQDVVRA